MAWEGGGGCSARLIIVCSVPVQAQLIKLDTFLLLTESCVSGRGMRERV